MTDATKDDATFFERIWQNDPFGAVLGYKIQKFDRANREAHATITIRADHVSPSGKVHGGVLTSVFDAVCGAAVCTTMTRHDRCSTVELKVNFYRPVHPGEKLEAVARVIFRGKKLCGLMATMNSVDKDSDEPIAMATATFNIAEA